MGVVNIFRIIGVDIYMSGYTVSETFIHNKIQFLTLKYFNKVGKNVGHRCHKIGPDAEARVWGMMSFHDNLYFCVYLKFLIMKIISEKI